MLAAERHQLILNTLQQQRKVSVTEMSKELKVSEDTLRRDLDRLAQDGLLKRVHGGALPLPTEMGEYSMRQQQFAPGKQAIAKKAVECIQPNQVVLLDSGTTTFAIAQALPRDVKITVITNCLPIALALTEHPYVNVVVLGGQLLKEAQLLQGAQVLEALQRIRADLCFVGFHAVHHKFGLTIPYLEESYIKRTMIEQSAEAVGVVNAQKLETVSTYTVAPVKELNQLITDKGAPEEVLNLYRDAGVVVQEV